MEKPTILLPRQFTETDLENLRKNNKIWQEIDIYESQLSELLEVNFPSTKVRQEKKQKVYQSYGRGQLAGAWIYYPWSGILLHTVGPDELYTLRTNRNKNLITFDEQNKLRSSVIGVAGMSVGSGIALGSVYAGIGNVIKLSDFDELATSNLNRVRESLANIGTQKLVLTSRKIWELDPFIKVKDFPKGLNTENIDQFFTSPSPHIVVDEIDDFKIKVLLRIKAKKYRVPLIMLTNLGDNILIDVERYDETPDLEIFNGAIGITAQEIHKKGETSPEDIKRYAVKLVGAQYIPTRALSSLAEIGKTLVGRPQLYSTTAVNGGLAIYLIRQILLGKAIPSGRYFVKFASIFNIDSNDLVMDSYREEILEKFTSND